MFCNFLVGFGCSRSEKNFAYVSMIDGQIGLPICEIVNQSAPLSMVRMEWLLAIESGVLGRCSRAFGHRFAAASSSE